jgi:DNA-binding MarR family transcriptional regulator
LPRRENYPNRPGQIVRVDEQIRQRTIWRMRDKIVFEIQRLYPQIYLACHVDHVRAGSTAWRLSSRDSSILAHLDQEQGMSPRSLARHLGVAPSTLSAAITRLVELGYISSTSPPLDKRRRELLLTRKGAEAMKSTSVLDAGRVTLMVARLTAEERQIALKGLLLLARAAGKLEARR